VATSSSETEFSGNEERADATARHVPRAGPEGALSPGRMLLVESLLRSPDRLRNWNSSWTPTRPCAANVRATCRRVSASMSRNAVSNTVRSNWNAAFEHP